MNILLNPVVISVLFLTVLALLKVNILIAILLAALVAGLVGGLPVHTAMSTLIGGMGGNSSMALAYILLGAMAAAIGNSGLVNKLVVILQKNLSSKKTVFVFVIAFVSIFSQNLLPVHIAFIPILIPPLLSLMNKMQVDRRAVASALTFGVKWPYIVIPFGFGAQFHEVLANAMTDNGWAINQPEIWPNMVIPSLGMIVGLFIAVLVTYRKPRQYDDAITHERVPANFDAESSSFTKEEKSALFGALVAVAVQVLFERNGWSGGLPTAALAALIAMLITGAIKFDKFDDVMEQGIGTMGFIAFVMLVAAGYGEVLRATGAVDALVQATASILGDSQIIAAVVMLLIGLLVTMGIGSSFSTIPIIATLYVPLCMELGFSVGATVALLGTAGALGDAGSPASDSTLGPTSGLNADGQHDHIWDSVVPSFIHYNIPLIIFGTIAAMVL